MTRYVKMLVVPALVLAAACGRNEKPMDDALKNDLSLASSMQPYQPQQFVSPMEQGYGGYGYGQYAQQPNGYYPAAPQPVAQRRIYRAPSSSGGTYSAPSWMAWPSMRIVLASMRVGPPPQRARSSASRQTA